MIDSVRGEINYAVYDQPSMNDGQVDGLTSVAVIVPVSRAFELSVKREIWNNVQTAPIPKQLPIKRNTS